jgi:hypothetical protein
MSYSAFEEMVARAWADEEKNREGELSQAQMDALKSCAGFGAVDPSLRRVRGGVLYTDGKSDSPLVIAEGRRLPIRPGLTLLSGIYECFVTARPEVVVGTSSSGIVARQLVDDYRALLLQAQNMTEEDINANRRGEVSVRQQRAPLGTARTAFLMFLGGFGGLLLVEFVGGWGFWEVVVGGLWSLAWFGLFLLVFLGALRLRREQVVVMHQVVTQKVHDGETPEISMGDWSVAVSRALWLALIPGMPYRVYRIAYGPGPAEGSCAPTKSPLAKFSLWSAQRLFALKFDLPEST